MKQCKGCATQHSPGQWWYLNHYHGFSGIFCAKCYDKISHNSLGQPSRPHDFVLMLLKLSNTNTVGVE